MRASTGSAAGAGGGTGGNPSSSASSGASSSASSSSRSGAGGGGTGNPNFTPDGCFRWSGPATSNIPLPAAVKKHACVEVQEGTFVLTSAVYMPPGHKLRGLSAAKSISKADLSWKFGCCDAMVSDTLPAQPQVNPYHVSRLIPDGSGVATYNVCCRWFTAGQWGTDKNVWKGNNCVGGASTGPTFF